MGTPHDFAALMGGQIPLEWLLNEDCWEADDWLPAEDGSGFGSDDEEDPSILNATPPPPAPAGAGPPAPGAMHGAAAEAGPAAAGGPPPPAAPAGAGPAW